MELSYPLCLSIAHNEECGQRPSQSKQAVHLSCKTQICRISPDDTIMYLFANFIMYLHDNVTLLSILGHKT